MHCISKARRAAVCLGAVMMCTIVNPFTIKAASFDDLNVEEMFLKQSMHGTCTLTSAAMMVRRTSLAQGDSDWESITESSLRGTAWREGVGLYYEFSYNGVDVKKAKLPGGSANTEELVSLLEDHPEGIVIYDTAKPHAILLTDYTDGVFYCADPANNIDPGRIEVSSAWITIDSCTEYWYVSSPEVTLDSKFTDGGD